MKTASIKHELNPVALDLAIRTWWHHIQADGMKEGIFVQDWDDEKKSSPDFAAETELRIARIIQAYKTMEMPL